MTVRVLIVEDDFMVARVHCGFINAMPGYEVAGVAGTAAEAITAVTELDPELVLLDLYLPDRHGLEVLREIGRLRPRAGVVVVTAQRDPDAVREALHLGALHFVVKPFEFQVLQTRLEQVRDLMRNLPTAPADQESLDRVFGSRGAAPNLLPKGLSAETAAVVEKALENVGETSAAECARRTGLSRVTARRYLEYLVEQEQATVRLRYGNAGRPERLYRLLNETVTG